MSRLFGIAGVQMSVKAWDMDGTFEKMSDVAMNVQRQFPWINMMVYHELIVPGLEQFKTPPHIDWWRKNSFPVPSAQTDRLRELARKTKLWLIPGSMWEIENEKMYNTAIVISPDGDIVVKYRKMFPWMPYEMGATPGDKFCVFDIPNVGRFGLCICYDMWFPETARTLAWMGAEVIIQPTLTPTADRPLELVMARANALFNQCYFVSVNGIGEWGGGRSTIIDPDGRILQEAGTNQTFMSEMIDLDHTTRTREYGTLGLAQTLKQLRDSGHKFPIYGNQSVSEEGFKGLGKLGFHRNTGLPIQNNLDT